MTYTKLFSRFTLKSISIILFAFSTIGLLSIHDNSDIDSNTAAHHPMTSLESETDAVENTISEDRRSVFVADGDPVVIKSFGTDLSYDVTEIRAKAGSTITVRYENVSDMPHNIVFVNTRADIQPVGVAGIRARDSGYVPQDADSQSRIFANTPLAKPGYTEHVTLTVPDPGTYPYICTYPGHFTMMQGDLISEE